MNLKNHLEGRGMVFEVDGVKYILRAPSPDERDEAMRVDSVAKRIAIVKNDEIKELLEYPAPKQEIELYESLID